MRKACDCTCPSQSLLPQKEPGSCESICQSPASWQASGSLRRRSLCPGRSRGVPQSGSRRWSCACGSPEGGRGMLIHPTPGSHRIPNPHPSCHLRLLLHPTHPLSTHRPPPLLPDLYTDSLHIALPPFMLPAYPPPSIVPPASQPVFLPPSSSRMCLRVVQL